MATQMSRQIQDTTRRWIIEELISIGSIPTDIPTDEFIEMVYPAVATMPSREQKGANRPKTRLDDIYQHMVNNEDWDERELLLNQLDLLQTTDDCFKQFLEGYVHPRVIRKKINPETGNNELIDNSFCVVAINKYLTGEGFKLAVTSYSGNQPVYSVVSLNSEIKGNLKNIIFASKSKPRIVFIDALNNDIQARNEEDCLIYDLPINQQGITWKELNDWYNDNNYPAIKGKSMLEYFEGILDSDAEKFFWRAYLDLANEKEGFIPALFPQVWLYFDPQDKYQRTQEIFEHQRMDFLMIFPENHRIIIEIDGKQHYSSKTIVSGQDELLDLADVGKYAKMMKAHRDMVLAGYEVYRFGGKEFCDKDCGKTLVKEFICDLLKKYNWK